MTALLTGATGFLGRRVVKELLDAGVRVRCFVRPSSAVGELPKTVEVVRGSIGNRDDCRRAVENCDAVYHVAAELTGSTSTLFLTNVTATRVLAESVVDAGVGRFVLVSSLGVYDAKTIPKHGTLDESSSIDAMPHLRDPYTYSKVVQEEVCWKAHADRGLPLVVVRPGVIYGPGRDCLSARVGLNVGRLIVMGGRQLLPYTHVGNCAAGVVRAGLAAGVDGRAFNLIDDGLVTAKELVKRYRAEVGRLKTVTLPHWAIGPLSGACEWYHRASQGQLPAVLTRYKSGAMWRVVRYSNDAAKAGLGWAPRIGMDEGLRETFAWLRTRAALAEGAA